MITIPLLLVLGVVPLISAQPTVTLLNNRARSCVTEAVSYRCEGTGPMLVWSIGSSQVVYDATTDQLGEGDIQVSESAITSLVQRTPSIVSILTVYENVNEPLNFTCSTGPDLASLIESNSPASYIPEPIPSEPVLSLGLLTSGMDIGVVEANFSALSGESGIFRLQFRNNGVLFLSLDISIGSNTVSIPFNRPSDGQTANIQLRGSIITECGQSSPMATSNTVVYTFPSDGGEPNPCPNPCQGLLIAVIVLSVVCGALVITVIGLAIGLSCEKKKPPPEQPPGYPLSSTKPTTTVT